MSKQHRKTVKIDRRATVAMTETAREVLLHAGFTSAVKKIYLDGNLHRRSADKIVPAVREALTGLTGLPEWDDKAIDAALGYLADRKLIQIPAGELVTA